MVTITGDVPTINSVVLGTLHMYHNKLSKPEVLEMIDVNLMKLS